MLVSGHNATHQQSRFKLCFKAKILCLPIDRGYIPVPDEVIHRP